MNDITVIVTMETWRCYCNDLKGTDRNHGELLFLTMDSTEDRPCGYSLQEGQEEMDGSK